MSSKYSKVVNFLFEIGILRKLPRSHQQTLLTQDLSDNISSHSYRVAILAWFLAKLEGVDPYKATLMALFHDTGETRTGDQNYIHKKYTKIFEKELIEEQIKSLGFDELYNLVIEYEERNSPESILAKDADLLDQILLLKEYEHQGNKEAEIWLKGKGNEKENNQIKRLKSKAAKKIGAEILKTGVSDWWKNIWTSKNR